MKLYENGKPIRDVTSIKRAKESINALDYSMACVDCDPQSYEVRDAKGRVVYSRPGYRVP